jgi:hypothetical protein
MHKAYKKGFILSFAADDILISAGPENAHREVKDPRRALVQTKAPTQDISQRARAGYTMGMAIFAPSTFLASPFAFMKQAAQLRRTCSALKPSGAPYCDRCCPCNSLCDFLRGAQKWLLVAGIVH